MYRYEIHCHTAESSSCGRVKAERLVELYVQAGYDGVVITDHLNPDNPRKLLEADGIPNTFENQVKRLLEGYHLARAAAGERLVVLHGMELRFVNDPNDYLVYGMTEELLLRHPDVVSWGIRNFSRFAREHGLLVIQAHPFRNNMRVIDPKWVDMIEVHNGHPRHQSRNELALLWAKMHGVPGSSGSDFHEEGDEARGGVLLPKRPETIHEFIKLMKEEQPLLITGRSGDVTRTA